MPEKSGTDPVPWLGSWVNAGVHETRATAALAATSNVRMMGFLLFESGSEVGLWEARARHRESEWHPEG